MSFGENLRALIEERGLTQKELAHRLNMAPSTLGNYVQNVREPDFDTLREFARFFGVSLDYLLDGPNGVTLSGREQELLRAFRALTDEQQAVCVEQCRAFDRVARRQKPENELIS